MNKTPEILIVDDNQGLALNLREIIELGGFTADTAFSGADALQLCRNKNYDLALVDLRLPDIAGTDLIPEMNKIVPDIKCIIMTAHASIETAASSVGKNGIVAYEIKPLDINRVLFLISEILARVQAEKALLDSEAYTRALIDSVKVGILVVDDESGEILDANPAAAEMSGVPKPEIPGKTINEFIKPREAAAENQDEIETLLIKPGGEQLQILNTSTKTSLKGRPCVIESFLDISDLKRMEREVRAAKDQAEAAIAARNEFLEQMNSEFRAPMTGVMGSIDSLLNQPLNDEQRKYAEHINDSFESILTILNDIIDLHGVDKK